MEGVSFEAIDPRDPAAQEALRRYLSEVSVHVSNPAVSPDEVDDVDDFMAPGGAFLVVRLRGTVVGCGAVRTLRLGLGELKRMWIAPRVRGRGLGARLLHSLENAGQRLGHKRMRLDTNEELVEAIHLYERHGYRRIDRYNDNPDATRFYEKVLLM